jgi:hypothetical protein
MELKLDTIRKNKLPIESEPLSESFKKLTSIGNNPSVFNTKKVTNIYNNDTNKAVHVFFSYLDKFSIDRDIYSKYITIQDLEYILNEMLNNESRIYLLDKDSRKHSIRSFCKNIIDYINTFHGIDRIDEIENIFGYIDNLLKELKYI